MEQKRHANYLIGNYDRCCWSSLYWPGETRHTLLYKNGQRNCIAHFTFFLYSTFGSGVRIRTYNRLFPIQRVLAHHLDGMQTICLPDRWP